MAEEHGEEYRNPKVVLFVNDTDQPVTFITESQFDSTPRKQFTLQPGGPCHPEPVPGPDALTYEDLLMVEGDDEHGTQTNINISTDNLRKWGGCKIIVTTPGDKPGDKFKLIKEELKKKSMVQQVTDLFSSGRRQKEAHEHGPSQV